MNSTANSGKSLVLESLAEQLLRAVPWYLDAQLQEPDTLWKTLQQERKLLDELRQRISLTIIVPVTELSLDGLSSFVASLAFQSFRHWEAIFVFPRHMDSAAAIKQLVNWATTDKRLRPIVCSTEGGNVADLLNEGVSLANSEYILFSTAKQVLHPMALGIFSRYALESLELDFVYANDAVLSGDKRVVSSFLSKPNFDLFTLLRLNYIGDTWLTKKTRLYSLLNTSDSIFKEELGAWAIHDLILRLGRGSITAKHIPLFLSYYFEFRRSTPQGAGDALQLKMLQEHAEALYGKGHFILTERPDQFTGAKSIWPTFSVDEPRPKIVVIVPFRDQVNLTIQCLESLEAQDTHCQLSVLLVDNQSVEKTTQCDLEAWIHAKTRRHNYVYLYYASEFNFARINNRTLREFTTSHSDHSLVLFLNNDVQLLTRNVLDTLAAQCLFMADTGFVGIQLRYPKSSDVQHGGIAFGPHSTGSGYSMIRHGSKESDFIEIERIAPGVSFACAMCKIDVFFRLEGLEELFVANGFGDVDICLRAHQAGYKNYYFGTLEGFHHESRTRGRNSEALEVCALFERNPQAIQDVRLRQLSLNLQPHLSLLALNTTVDPIELRGLPLRYKLIDVFYFKLKGTIIGGMLRNWKRKKLKEIDVK